MTDQAEQNTALTFGEHHVGPTVPDLSAAVASSSSRRPAPAEVDAATPFHAGESLVQTRMGVREAIEPFARRVVRDHMPEQHRDFYRRLPFVVLAARDDRARPWTTLVADPDGVVASPDPYTLDLRARPAPGDALEHALSAGADVGVLGIEFHTRRRNRVNGRICGPCGGGLRLRVDQSFGNCPQYIHGRQWRRARPSQPPDRRVSERLDDGQRDWIARADTFFLASGFRGEGEDPAFGMDASHRGGDAGFVRVLDARTLVWPDYAGNNHYNTIGNLAVDPRIGMLFVDFETGSLLQLTGHAEVDWAPEPERWPGAQHLVKVRLAAVNELREALPLRWRASPQLELRVDEVTEEGAAVRSFWLLTADGSSLPSFKAGQHLLLEVPLAGRQEVRTYSLSSAPGDRRWRISVKREAHGRVSSHLHRAIAAGSTLRAAPPAGDFVLTEGAVPIVLIGAGIGVTPLVSMLAEAVSRGREVRFVYAARNGRLAPLADEIRALARHSGVRAHILFSQPAANDRAGIDFDTTGRLTAAILRSLLPGGAFDVYVCGPPAFVSDVSAWIEDAGVPTDRIQSESFG